MIYLTLETLGIGFWVGGILANLDNGKSWVLFMLGAMYGVMRLVFTWQQKSQAIREKELELWHKEQDKIDRINKKKDVA